MAMESGMAGRGDGFVVGSVGANYHSPAGSENEKDEEGADEDEEDEVHDAG